jgi:hypothetical protein
MFLLSRIFNPQVPGAVGTLLSCRHLTGRNKPWDKDIHQMICSPGVQKHASPATRENTKRLSPSAAVPDPLPQIGRNKGALQVIVASEPQRFFPE